MHVRGVIKGAHMHKSWPVNMYKIYHFIDVRRHEHVDERSAN